MTLAFSNIEFVAWLGLMWGTYGLLPESAQLDWEGLFQAFDFQTSIPKAFFWWGAVCHMVIVTLIEPFYVGAGFALYLNCRTRIEGWDVELAFKRLARRLTKTALLWLALGSFVMPMISHAAAERDQLKLSAGQSLAAAVMSATAAVKSALSASQTLSGVGQIATATVVSDGSASLTAAQTLDGIVQTAAAAVIPVVSAATSSSGPCRWQSADYPQISRPCAPSSL